MIIRSVLLLLLLIPSCLLADEATLQAKKWNGTWTVKRLQVEGVDAPTDLRNKITVIIEGNYLTVKGFDSNDVKNTFTLTNKPKHGEINLTPVRENATSAKGIFKFEGTTLSLCVSDSGERPTEFTTTPKSGEVLMILEKAQ